MEKNSCYILTIDGPSGSGKGTVSQQLALKHHWHYLDSGAVYRVIAFAIEKYDFQLDENTPQNEIEAFVMSLDTKFLPGSDGGISVMLNGEDVNNFIRTEAHGIVTSKYAVLPKLRAALLQWQRSMAKAPGLVADGRDMGTVVFPDANLKIFLNASAEERAKRRFNQLKKKGINVNLASLVEEVRARDEQDSTRKSSPMVPAEDAVMLDSTHLSIEQVIQEIEKLIVTN